MPKCFEAYLAEAAQEEEADFELEQDESPCTTSLNDVFRDALERLRNMGITSSTLECCEELSREDLA